MPDDLGALVRAVNAPLTDPERMRVIGEGTPRFELYHFALSLCSQKVRLCLVEKGAAFTARDINLSLPNLANYDPPYVRLRLSGAPDAPLATGYTGRSSVSTEGFDPAVVPTMVDHEARQVLTDSLSICLHIDAVVEPTRSLVPDDVADEVWRELAIVDRTPHVAVFYGAHPDGDFRPERMQKGMPGVHDRKIGKLRMARERAAGDAALVRAYDAKIAKEEAAKEHVSTPDRMRESVRQMLSVVADLEGRLEDGREWIAGGRLTLADLFWSVSLYRMKWLGLAFAWDGHHALNDEARPRVRAYGERLFRRPTFRSAVMAWPKTPPSEHVADLDDD